jgi:hypothetical protein
LGEPEDEEMSEVRERGSELSLLIRTIHITNCPAVFSPKSYQVLIGRLVEALIVELTHP